MSILSREETADLHARLPTPMHPTPTDKVENQKVENLSLPDRGSPTSEAMKTMMAADNPACPPVQNVVCENACAGVGHLPCIRFRPYLDIERAGRPSTAASTFDNLKFLTPQSLNEHHIPLCLE
jgi:hypothetical protein